MCPHVYNMMWHLAALTPWLSHEKKIYCDGATETAMQCSALGRTHGVPPVDEGY